jgi:hypothetical protein
VTLNGRRPRMRVQLGRYGTNIAKWGNRLSLPVRFQGVARGKKSTRHNVCVTSLTATFERHSPNRHLADSKNLDSGPTEAASICASYLAVDVLGYAMRPCCVFGANSRIVISSIMRRRNGLMASGLVGHGDAPVLREVANPHRQDTTLLCATGLTASPAAAPCRASGLVLWQEGDLPVVPLECPQSGVEQTQGKTCILGRS